MTLRNYYNTSYKSRINIETLDEETQDTVLLWSNSHNYKLGFIYGLGILKCTNIYCQYKCCSLSLSLLCTMYVCYRYKRTLINSDKFHLCINAYSCHCLCKNYHVYRCLCMSIYTMDTRHNSLYMLLVNSHLSNYRNEHLQRIFYHD